MFTHAFDSSVVDVPGEMVVTASQAPAGTGLPWAGGDLLEEALAAGHGCVRRETGIGLGSTIFASVILLFIVVELFSSEGVFLSLLEFIEVSEIAADVSSPGRNEAIWFCVSLAMP